tara:strand:+ start:216 stop:1049 length:834 start_codon:yes stop_codon:yes gene_type:complete
MIGFPADALIQQTLEELQDDPRELRRYKDFSLYADLLPFLPTNIKAYIQSQLGIDRDFSELDLTNKEIAELDRIMFEQGTFDPNQINYLDYQTTDNPDDPYADIARNVVGVMAKHYDVSEDEILARKDYYVLRDPKNPKKTITLAEAEKKYPGILNADPLSIRDLLDPAFSMKTFIGRGDVVTDENGNIIIEDTYNFGSPETNAIERKNLKGVGLGDNPVYEAARRLPLYNPLNTEYSVDLNLGTREEYEKRKARQNRAVGGFVESGIAIQNILNEI